MIESGFYRLSQDVQNTTSPGGAVGFCYWHERELLRKGERFEVADGQIFVENFGWAEEGRVSVDHEVVRLMLPFLEKNDAETWLVRNGLTALEVVEHLLRRGMLGSIKKEQL